MPRLRYRGRKLRVTITSGHAKYELLDGEPLPVVHHGKEFELGKKATERDPAGDRRAAPGAAAWSRPVQPRRHLTRSRPSRSCDVILVCGWWIGLHDRIIRLCYDTTA